MTIVSRCGIATFALLLWVAMNARTQEKPATIPVVKGGAGPCSADFTITGAEKKPLYDAKIQILLKYGFAGMRRLDLTVGTNADGKARFEGLPNKVRQPAEFEVRHAEKKKSVPFDPVKKCNPTHEVTLE